MTERCLSFDLEWSTRDYPETGVRDGDLACLQWCELLADGTTGEPEVLPAWRGADARAREVFADALCSPSWVILGQNVAGDVLKAALHWGLLREADRAYAQGRVRCTFLAQRLIDVAWPGRLTWVRLGGPKKRDEVDLDAVDDSQEDEVGGDRGFWSIKKYRPHRLYGREQEFSTDDDEGGRGNRAKAGLDTLVAVHLGLDIAADKKRGGDGYRMRYGELIGVPVDEWPEEARRYAAKDPVLTAQVRAAQVRRPPAPYAGPWCDALYPTPDAPPWAPLRCERFECYAHFALEDMARLGLVRDQPRVERMRATLQRAAQAAEGAAIRAGVVRLEVSQDMQERAKRAAAGSLTGSQCLADLREARALADRRELNALQAFVAERPWLVVDCTKDSKKVLARAEALYRAAGWRELPRTNAAPNAPVSAGAEHLQQVVRPRPDADPDAAADLRELVGPDLLSHLQAWTDAGEMDRITRALDAANDSGLAAHMVRQKCGTFDSSFLKGLDERERALKPDRWRDPKGPARFGFSPFKSTGRTGIRGDVRQNMPKAGGVRECFVPRPGRVFLCVDYAACEMSTFADVLDEMVLGGRGWSTLGQAIRAGDDCHLRLAATMRGEPYAQLLAFYKPLKRRIETEGKGAIPAGELHDWLEIDLDRAGAKEGNFGYAGGMGPRKFARLQRKKGRDCDEDRARQIRDAWMECWSPEVPAYFDLASQATGDRRGRKSATLIHGGGGHVRGGLDFCQWANTGFQEKAARGAKRAIILMFRACRFDASSPLYGVCDPALFVHDEIISECDEPHAEAALAEVSRLMEQGMAAVCRTPVRTEGKILRERWSK